MVTGIMRLTIDIKVLYTHAEEEGGEVNSSRLKRNNAFFPIITNQYAIIATNFFNSFVNQHKHPTWLFHFDPVIVNSAKASNIFAI